MIDREVSAPKRQASLPIGLLALLSLLLLLGLFFPTLSETVRICLNDPDYSHGLLLPLVSAYLIYEKKSVIRDLRITKLAPDFSYCGLFLLILGLLTLQLGILSDIHFIRWFAFFPTAVGLLHLVVGNALARPFVAPILLLFMAKPLPDALVPKLFFPLQVFAARTAAWTLDRLSVPVYLRGNIIEIPGMELMVEQACSGLRSLLALLTVACIVVVIVPLSRLSQLTVIVTAILTAIFLNVFRVTLTGILAQFYDPQMATGFFHAFSGMVVFFVGLIIVYGLANALQRKPR